MFATPGTLEFTPFQPQAVPVPRSAPFQHIGQRKRVWIGRALSVSIFVGALAVRLIGLGQPLVENFIDRQVHTAMIARNLARGGLPLYPEIDIGPFPAYYMLEFPGYSWLVGTFASLACVPLDMMGRLVSAVAMAGACWFLFDLMRRRDGNWTAVLACVAMAAMPVTIRFGRAFQPDSLMIASLLAAIWAMERWTVSGSHRALAAAALATCFALLLKAISAYVLLPIAYLAWTRYGWSFLRRWELWLALAIAFVPALAWYLHAWRVAATSGTVSAPFWHAHKWVSLTRLGDLENYRQLAYFIGIRTLTPIGVVLAAIGLLLRVQRPPVTDASLSKAAPSRTMLIHVWLLALVAYFPILMRKVDHEHYYLALAPVAAVLIARALVALATIPIERRCYVSGRVAAATLGSALLFSDAIVCRSTFRVPSEWRHVTEAAAAARQCTPAGALVAAHSSVLFYADRRGFTFAYGPDEIGYLFSTWGLSREPRTPADLLEFYRRHGAAYFVELLGTNRERENAEFLKLVRARYDVVREEPGKFLVVALAGQEVEGVEGVEEVEGTHR